VEKDIDDNRLQRHQEETNLVYDPATQSIKSLDSTTNSSSLRILALHGKGGSGPCFYQTLTPLLEQLSGHKSDIATDNNINGGETSVQCDCLTAPLPEGKWWEQHPPGSRSYNAVSYEGYEKAADMVQSALSLKADKHYDILLGHSQGAILIVSMLANKDLTNANTPPLLILNGVAWPNPFGRQLEELKFCYSNDETCTSPKKIPEKSDQAINETSYFSKSTKAKALFIMGENDKINPIQGAMLVRDNLLKAGLDVSTIVHSGGHSLPTENKVILESIIQWINQPSHSRKKAG
jgi:predicted esterase